jgi:ABC-type transport system substrate-binding protein
LPQRAGVPIKRLRRLVLKELVDNALDAADQPGRPGTVTLSKLGAHTYTVEDQGGGIDGGDEAVLLMFSIDRKIRSTKAWRANVAVDMMQKVGMNAELQTFDWATLLQRVQKKEPVDQGGWSCITFQSAAIDFIDPAVNPYLRGNGLNSPRPGWPTSPRTEELRDAWIEASDLATRKRIATEIQLQAFQDIPYIPICLVRYFTAYRNDLSGVLPGFSVFWNVRRQA